ncbi:hypothetical protein E4T42_06067 [Aureobasidium subglaciale]|uniref:Uncharacterized protein n=1 Tax=Aureobasidium subglaciale (strain EXF-2481) TaxID=1043005 RepID=A0A074Y7S4_AURSE|nr:uncharacterized protein AUEXF2481DRAFT_32502 [Aureobasidium subglaciale EXF-2481]KAI5207326.1 hypothetical protein E4T38_03433 [Aureobasidium subglaciale]KAI5226255.1 hypothetical protein E4T40_03188 [Aureobasidium subglaciale]KAI5229579.1 hypothetical protein E4T41_03430 [Aureobasidium subglaciale]KAI5247129.1 hypothetical protein E4T42_06067 [Aureobasidium subglaciale]KAI5264215.1 hypothetical protein E4T46_03207 [Aureobasidium subglaciale]
MQFITAFVSLFVAAVTAFPTKPGYLTQPLQPRDSGDVYACTGANFTDVCAWFRQPFNSCVDFPTELSKQVSSFGPDPGADCMLMQGHCNDTMFYRGNIKYPGIFDLANVTFDNIATSFICMHQFNTEEVSKSE